METEQYRFHMGSLFEYDKESHAYIHCYRRAGCGTKRQAIKEYEEVDAWDEITGNYEFIDLNQKEDYETHNKSLSNYRRVWRCIS